MKKTKKLLALVIAMLMIVGTFGNFTAFAAGLADVSSVASATIGESRYNAPLDYDVGEDIEFYFTLKSGADTVVAPYLHYSAEMDDGRTLSGYVEAVDGEYTVTLDGGLLRPGFVRLTVSACDKNKNSYSKDTIPAVAPYTCSAGAAVSDISSVYGAPDAYDEFGDFNAFWAEAVSQLDKTQATLDFIYYCGEKEVNGVLYDCYEIEINCPEDEYYNSVTGKWHEDNHTMAYLTVPKGKTDLGLKVRYHGYDVVLPNSKSGSIEAGNGLFVADKISLSVSPHAIPAPHNVENAVDTEYVSGDAYLHTYYTNYTGYLAKTYGYSNNHGYNTEENSNPNTTYFKYMILRDLQALNFIKLYFGEKAVSGYESWAGLWDGENILVTGPSQGGLQSLAVAGLDSDVNEVDVEVPWCGDVGAVTKDSDRAKSTLTSKIGFREGLRYIDVANHAANISKDCKVTINAGLIDAICPPSTIFSIYNNLNCDATLTMHQNKAHSTSGTVIYKQTLSKEADNSANERVISFAGSVDSSVKESFGDAWQNVSGETVVSSGANSIAVYVVDKNTTTDFASLAKNSTAEAIGIVLTGNDLTKINEKLAEIYALHNDVNSKVWVISNSGTFNASDAENAAINLDACLGGGDRPTENASVSLYGKDGQMGTSFALTANEIYAIIPSPLYLSGKGILSECENVTLADGVMSSNGEDGSIKLRVPPCDADYSVVGIGDVDAYGTIDGVGLWFVKDECLTVKGSGAIPSYASASATPWSAYNISEVIIEEGITAIGAYAFYKKAVTITIPFSVKEIGNAVRSGSTVIGYDNTYAKTYAESKNLTFQSLGGFGECGENLFWQFDNESGIFRVTGTGDNFQPLDADGNVLSIDWQGTNASKRQYHVCATKVKQIIIEAPVTTISAYAFSGFSACEVLELPVTYTSVGVVLNGMKALDTVYTTGNEAEKGTADFSNIASFGWYAASAINAKKIIIGDKTTSIGTEVFKNCKSLEEIVFANKLTSISQNAFQNCTALKAVSLPSSVKTVNADAFKGCTALEELTVENKDLEISGFASGMTALKKIIGHSGSPAEAYANSNEIEFESLSFVLNDMPAGDGVFYRLVDNGDGTYTMEFYGDGTAIKAMNTSGEYFTSDSYSGYVGTNDYLKSTHYLFKDKVTKIKYLTPNVVDLPGYYFMGFKATEVELHPNMKALSADAFNGIKTISTIYTTGQSRVEGTADLSNINSLGSYCFQGSVFKKVIFGSELKSVGYMLFYNCKSLESIELPENITGIDSTAFQGCIGVTSLKVENANLNVAGFAPKLTSLAKIIGHDGSTAETYANANSIEFVSLGESGGSDEPVVEGMPAGEDMFFRVIAENGGYTMEFFGNGTEIRAVNASSGEYIPGGYNSYVTGGGSRNSTHWTYRSQVTKVRFLTPNLTTISGYYFYDFRKIAEVEFHPDMKTVSTEAFLGITAIKTCYTTGQTPETGTANLSNFTSIANYAFAANLFEKIIFGDEITTVGYQVFQGCKSLKSIELPENIKTVNSEAFKDCVGVTEVTVYNAEFNMAFAASLTGLTKIIGYAGSSAQTYANEKGIAFEVINGTGDEGGDEPIAQYPAGEDVYYRIVEENGIYIMEILGDGTSMKAVNADGEYLADSYNGYLANNAYKNATHYVYKDQVTKVRYLTPNLADLPGYYFYGFKIDEVEFHTDMKTLTQDAFNGIKTITTLYTTGQTPEAGTANLSNFSTLGSFCFQRNLFKKIIFSSELTGVGYEIFTGCTALESIELPENIKGVDATAFKGCTGVKTLAVYCSDVNVTNFAGTLTSLEYIIGHDGSSAQTYAEENDIGFISLEATGLLSFDGFKIRETDYNGLRSVYTADLTEIANLSENGFSVVEFGCMVASDEKLNENGEELGIEKDTNGDYISNSYASKVTIMKNGKFTGSKILSADEEKVEFALTIINFSKETFEKDFTFRGYMVISDEKGNEYILYADLKDDEGNVYNTASFATTVERFVEDGLVDPETNISYLDVKKFREEEVQ